MGNKVNKMDDVSPDDIYSLLDQAVHLNSEALKLLKTFQQRSDSYIFFIEILKRPELQKNIQFQCLTFLKTIVLESKEHRTILRPFIFDYINENYQNLYTPDYIKNKITDIFVLCMEDTPEMAVQLISNFISAGGNKFILGIELASQYIQITPAFQLFNTTFPTVCRILQNPETADLEKAFCIHFISIFTQKLFSEKIEDIPSYFRDQISIISITGFFANIIRVPPKTGIDLIKFFICLAKLPPITFIPSIIENPTPEEITMKHIESISEIISNLSNAFQVSQVIFDQYGNLADLSIEITSINLVKSIDNVELFNNWVVAVFSALQKSITKDSLIKNHLIAEKLLTAFYELTKFQLFLQNQEFIEKLIPELINNFYNTLFETTTVQSSCLASIYENDVSNSLFTNFAQLLLINYANNIENLVNMINELASTRNNGIAACIEIGAKLISHRSKIKDFLPSDNINIDTQLITTVFNVVVHLEHLENSASFERTNNPKIWLELALVHFFVSVQKAYKNTAVGKLFFANNPNIITIFFSRVLFDLSSEDIDFNELKQMVDCLDFDSFPDEVINDILSNEEVMNTVVACRFPFVLDESCDDQAKALYRTLFSIANRCQDSSVLSAILQSNIPRLENPALVKCTLDSLLGFFETKKNIEYTMNFFVESIFPKILEISDQTDISEFCMKYSQVVQQQSDEIPCLSEMAMVQYNSFLQLIGSVIQNADRKDLTVVSNLTSSIYNLLLWKCINLGVLHLYGNKDIFRILADYFDFIFRFDLRTHINDSHFVYSLLKIIIDASFIFSLDEEPMPIKLRLKLIDTVTLLITVVSLSDNDIDSICKMIQSSLVTSDVVNDDDGCTNRLLTSLCSYYVSHNFPNIYSLKETIFSLIKVENDFRMQAVFDATKNKSDEEKDFIISILEYIFTKNYDESVWTSLNEALRMIIESTADIE